MLISEPAFQDFIDFESVPIYIIYMLLIDYIYHPTNIPQFRFVYSSCYGKGDIKQVPWSQNRMVKTLKLSSIALYCVPNWVWRAGWPSSANVH